MKLEKIYELKKTKSKRCTFLMDTDHKRYIKELAYLAECRECDALYYIIEAYRQQFPIDLLKSHHENL